MYHIHDLGGAAREDTSGNDQSPARCLKKKGGLMRSFLRWPCGGFVAGRRRACCFPSMRSPMEDAGYPDANIANGKKIFTEGKGDAVTACETCHGATGWGIDAMGAPRLAKSGIITSSRNCPTGRRQARAHGAGAVMVVYAGGLKEQDRRDIPPYVNTLNGPPEYSDLSDLKDSGTAIGEKYLGQAIVKYGVSERCRPALPAMATTAAERRRCFRKSGSRSTAISSTS